MTSETDALLAQRRRRIAAALPLDDAILIVGAGEPIPLPEATDQTYPFRPHLDYFYLAGLESPRGLLAYDPRDAAAPDGGWVSFVAPVTDAERIWEGVTERPGRSLAEFPGWLTARASRTVVLLGAKPEEPAFTVDAAKSAHVRTHFLHARRPKEPAEVAQVRQAVAATAAGFTALQAALRPGVTERALQVELEAGFFRAGGRRTGYGSIVGSGPNAAVLHFEPSSREVQPGELVLVDAGAEIGRYTADVTRTYFAGPPEGFRRDLYQVVLAAQERAIGRCVAGAEWKEIHLATAVDLVAGLISLKVMRGEPTSLVEQEAHTLFFPHGLGHLVGLGVRDASGNLPGRPKDPRPSLRTLRMDLPLAPGYLVTVEPGLYFIPLLLNDPARRNRYRDAVNWAVVEQHLQVGGVRIEDNVLVTPGAPDVLTRGISKAL